MVCTLNRRENKQKISLNINGNAISQSNCLKYLGIDIDDHLSLRKHCIDVNKRARSMLGALCGALRKWKLYSIIGKLYLSTILPVMSYGACLSYNLSRCNDNLFEGTHRLAASISLNKYDYNISTEQLLHSLKWPTFSNIARSQTLSQTFKYVRGLVPLYAGFKHVPMEMRHYNTRKCINPLHIEPANRYRICSARIEKSYVYRAVSMWNMLPDNILQQQELRAFKRMTQL